MNGRRRKRKLYEGVRLAATPRSSRIDREALPAEIHAACLQYGAWLVSRGLYGAPRRPGSVLGDLREPGVPAYNEGRDGFASADMVRFHAGVLSCDHLQQVAFRLFYVPRQRKLLVKVAAGRIGMERNEFRRAVNHVARKAFAVAFGMSHRATFGDSK